MSAARRGCASTSSLIVAGSVACSWSIHGAVRASCSMRCVRRCLPVTRCVSRQAQAMARRREHHPRVRHSLCYVINTTIRFQ